MCPLYERRHRINDFISVEVPTLREILADEDAYYSATTMIVATPYDMMVQLNEIGIDFTTINEWDLFCLLFSELKTRDCSLIFGDLELSKFSTAVNKQNGNVVLRNPETGAVIDRLIHNEIARYLRSLLGIEKNDKKPANEEAKRYMIERAEKKQRAAKRRGDKGYSLETYITALVNTPEFKYNYDTVLDLSIYQFNSSLKQITKKVRFDNLMIGCYAGTVKMSDIDPKELNWLES